MKNIIIGADVSKRTLDCVLHDEDKQKMLGANHLKITNDKNGCDELLKWLKQKKISRKEVLFCMEHTGDYSYGFAELLAEKGVSFCQIHPMEIKRATATLRGKNDKVDAVRIANYAYRYRDELEPSTLKDKDILRIRDLLNDRKLVVKCRRTFKTIMTEYKNKQECSRYQRAKRNVELCDGQVGEIEAELLEIVNGNESLVKTYMLLTSIPGISLVNAFNFIVVTCNFTSFKTARQLAAYCGIAPYEYTSGTSVNKGTHVSKMGNKEIKADLTMAAQAAILWDTDLRLYYTRKRAEGKSFGCVLNAVKFKLVCRMFAVVKRGTVYVDTKKYAS